MARKPRTPKEIAKAKPTKKRYSFFLEKDSTERLAELAKAADVPVSELVDEAIKAYMEAIKENGSNNNHVTPRG
jgi:post-segregation antitoxin (ccd killing protein)